MQSASWVAWKRAVMAGACVHRTPQFLSPFNSHFTSWLVILLIPPTLQMRKLRLREQAAYPGLDGVA